MARDYKHVGPSVARPKPRPKARRRKEMPGWLWLVLGMALGLSAAGLWWWNASPEKEAAGPQKGGEAPRAAPSVHYEFYKVLPERRVPVAPPAAEAHRPKPVPPKPSSGYLVQVGSFKALAPADRLKAELALLGVEAAIEKVSVRGETLYRVRIGPFSDKAQARAVQSRLRTHRLEAIIVQR